MDIEMERHRASAEAGRQNHELGREAAERARTTAEESEWPQNRGVVLSHTK